MKIVVQVLAGFWLIIGVVLLAYALIGAIRGAYEYFILDLHNGRLGGSIIIIVAAGILTACSYISVRYIKYYTPE